MISEQNVDSSDGSQGSDRGTAAPVWHVPIDSRAYFTGRNDLLNLLYQEATSSGRAILTHGLTGQGGVGKSRLAAEYAHRHRKDYDLIWWVRSSAQSAMNEDLARLGEELGVWAPSSSRWREAGAKVREWLEATDSKWLLVFDDVEEPEALQRALPSKGRGHVLITARNPSKVPANVRPVSVDVLPVESAVHFLLTRTGATDDDGAEKVARELGGLALALEQASAYIAATGVGFGEYLRRIGRYRRRSKGNNFRLGRLRKPSAEDRVMDVLEASCMLSMDTVTEAEPWSRSILEYLSFLDSSPIELRLLRELEPSLKISVRPLRTLSRYALIEFAADESAVIHPSVQQIMRSRMDAVRQNVVRQRLIQWLEVAFPEQADDRRSWRICGALAPHVASVLDNTARYEELSAQLLLHRLGKYLYSRGDSRSSLLYLQRAASAILRSATSPADVSDVILNDLAVVWADEGDWARAVEVGVEIFQRRLARVPEAAVDGPLVAFASNVAAALADSGRLIDADEIYRWLHSNSIKVAPSMELELFSALVAARHNWASVRGELGDVAAAESGYREVLNDKIIEYGSAHPETVVSLLGLAQILRKRGDFQGALALAENAFNCAERVLGEYHPLTLSALDLLAALSDDNDELPASFVFAERAYGRRRDAVGVDHPSTIEALYNLASITRRSGDPRHATELFERLVRVLEETLGPKHPKTVGVVRELTLLRDKSGSLVSRTRSFVDDMRSHVDDETSSVTRRRLFLQQVEVLD
ncbi:TPR repeat-containing protein [Micromonospora maris AB-18-032]|nr:TPR repeat-containing protein [Micromonospora maris AB-18-032]